MKIRHWIAPAAGAAAIPLIVFAGYAIAQTTIPPGTIHGCVDTSGSRALTSVYTSNTNGTTCPAGSMQIIFPKGPTSAGPNGLDLQAVTGSGAAATDVATCPADHPYVISGGFTVESGGPVISSQPQTSVLPQGWTASVASGQIAAHAICAR